METFWFFRLRLRRAYESAYDSDFRFSLGHKLSYDYDSDSDSVASENQPLWSGVYSKEAFIAKLVTKTVNLLCHLNVNLTIAEVLERELSSKAMKYSYFELNNIMYQSNRSFNIPPRAYPGYLTSFPAREGGNLINLVFPGAGIWSLLIGGGEFDR